VFQTGLGQKNINTGLKIIKYPFLGAELWLKLNQYKNSSRSKLPASRPKQFKHHPGGSSHLIVEDGGRPLRGFRELAQVVPGSFTSAAKAATRSRGTSEDVSSMYGEVWGSKFNVEISKTNTQQE